MSEALFGQIPKDKSHKLRPLLPPMDLTKLLLVISNIFFAQAGFLYESLAASYANNFVLTTYFELVAFLAKLRCKVLRDSTSL